MLDLSAIKMKSVMFSSEMGKTQDEMINLTKIIANNCDLRQVIPYKY